MNEFNTLFILIGVISIVGFVAITITESAKEAARPDAIAACMAVDGMQYKYGNCISR